MQQNSFARKYSEVWVYPEEAREATERKLGLQMTVIETMLGGGKEKNKGKGKEKNKGKGKKDKTDTCLKKEKEKETYMSMLRGEVSDMKNNAYLLALHAAHAHMTAKNESEKENAALFFGYLQEVNEELSNVANYISDRQGPLSMLMVPQCKALKKVDTTREASLLSQVRPKKYAEEKESSVNTLRREIDNMNYINTEYLKLVDRRKEQQNPNQHPLHRFFNRSLVDIIPGYTVIDASDIVTYSMIPGYPTQSSIKAAFDVAENFTGSFEGTDSDNFLNGFIVSLYYLKDTYHEMQTQIISPKYRVVTVRNIPLSLYLTNQVLAYIDAIIKALKEKSITDFVTFALGMYVKAITYTHCFLTQSVAEYIMNNPMFATVNPILLNRSDPGIIYMVFCYNKFVTDMETAIHTPLQLAINGTGLRLKEKSKK